MFSTANEKFQPARSNPAIGGEQMEEFENSFFLQAIRDAQQPPPVELANGETLERLKNPPSCMMTDGEDDVEQLAPNLASIESDNDGSFSDGLFQLAERRIGELAKQNEMLSRENARLRESSTTAKATTRPSIGERDALERKIAQLLEENHGLLRAIEQLRGQRIEGEVGVLLGTPEDEAQTPQERETLFARMRALIAKLNRRREEQQQTLDSFIDKLKGKEAEVHEKDKAVAALKQETEEHRDALKRAQATIATLDSKIDEHLVREREAARKHTLLREHNSKLTAALATYKETCEQAVSRESVLNEHIRAQDREIGQLNRSMQASVQEREQWSTQIKGLQDKLAQMQSEAEQTAREHRTQMSSLHKENQQLKIDLHNALLDQETLQQTLESKYKEKEQILSMYNEQLAKNEEHIKRQHELLSELANLRAASQGATVQDTSQNAALADEVGKLKREVAKREKQIAKVLDERAVLSKELDAIRAKLSSSETQKVTLNDQIAQLSLSVAALKGAISSLESEKALLRASLASNEGSLSKQKELYDRIHVLTRELDLAKQAREQFTTDERKRRDMQQQLAQLTEQCQQIGEELSEERQNLQHVQALLTEEAGKRRTMENELQSSRAQLQVTASALEREKLERERAGQSAFGELSRLRSENESLKRQLFQSPRSTNKPQKAVDEQPKGSAVHSLAFVQAIRNAKENLQNAMGTGAESPISSVADPMFALGSPVLSVSTLAPNEPFSSHQM